MTGHGAGPRRRRGPAVLIAPGQVARNERTAVRVTVSVR